jgi:hypothetical protein
MLDLASDVAGSVRSLASSNTSKWRKKWVESACNSFDRMRSLHDLSVRTRAKETSCTIHTLEQYSVWKKTSAKNNRNTFGVVEVERFSSPNTANIASPLSQIACSAS